jgi:hypothetical protein
LRSGQGESTRQHHGIDDLDNTVGLQHVADGDFGGLHETATIGNLSPADLLRPRVDGGRISDPVSDARIAATRRLTAPVIAALRCIDRDFRNRSARSSKSPALVNAGTVPANVQISRDRR